MKFVVWPAGKPVPQRRDTVFLIRSDWDDWFKYETLFDAQYVDHHGEIVPIGGTKIGRFGLQPARASDVRDGHVGRGHRSPNPPQQFDVLGTKYFSLGQDPSFYETLTSLGDSFREEFLTALRDLAYDPELLARAEAEEVTRVSLLRDVPLPTARGQFARLARGGVRLTPYRFPLQVGSEATSIIRLDVQVVPDSRPPTNIQVLIGRNGVGKSTYLNNLATALVDGSDSADDALDDVREQLSNVVSVSFSAFDSFEPITVPQDRTKGLSYHYVGLKKIGARNQEPTATKDPRALSNEMARSARSCLIGARRTRWRQALTLLESDPIFAEAELSQLVGSDSHDEKILSSLSRTFRRFSSGHKIVLLTITRLVETVEEKSLVLLDEPEAHLHPPLLSAFVRTLSDLLAHRNGIAVIATHSPVVLQEVPRSCVWRLRRSGHEATVEQLRLETFAENVGTLTDDVFGLEVTATGFHKMLAEAALQYRTYDQALASFGGQLGAEGRAILRAMIDVAGAARVER
ncbi:AAA family ATPase [Nocardia sp. BMG111209]|uniref:AAA family ATPase n=1 Tax=Nocardia sp. BMG111209 TaxID=1160137 RepID=UPI00037D9156|nr:AAA family ATPase [Nocardia sp. BMG111209]